MIQGIARGSQGEPRGAYNMKYASMYDHKPKYLLAPMIFD